MRLTGATWCDFVYTGKEISSECISFDAQLRMSRKQLYKSGFVRVLENLESPGILLWHFPGLESPGKVALVLESSGNLLNSTKKDQVYGRQ